MIDFSTPKKSLRELPLTSLIDVVFILIFFFMLTTSFIKIESMELMLPSGQKAPLTSQDISRIIIYNDGQITFGQREVNLQEMQTTLNNILKEKPAQAVVVFVDDQVLMQTMVTVLDAVNLAGGQSIYIRALKKQAALPLATESKEVPL